MIDLQLMARLEAMSKEHPDSSSWDLSLEIFTSPEFKELGLSRQAIYFRVQKARGIVRVRGIRSATEAGWICPICKEALGIVGLTGHLAKHDIYTKLADGSSGRTRRKCSVCNCQVHRENYHLHQHCVRGRSSSTTIPRPEVITAMSQSVDKTQDVRHNGFLRQFVDEVSLILTENADYERRINLLTTELSAFRNQFEAYKVKVSEAMANLR